MNEYTIGAGQHGGYFVYLAYGAMRDLGGSVSKVLFAGSLRECLRFIEDQYANPVKA
jgi:hypothetical protein